MLIHFCISYSKNTYQRTFLAKLPHLLQSYHIESSSISPDQALFENKWTEATYYTQKNPAFYFISYSEFLNGQSVLRTETANTLPYTEE